MLCATTGGKGAGGVNWPAREVRSRRRPRFRDRRRCEARREQRGQRSRAVNEQPVGDPALGAEIRRHVAHRDGRVAGSPRDHRHRAARVEFLASTAPKRCRSVPNSGRVMPTEPSRTACQMEPLRCGAGIRPTRGHRVPGRATARLRDRDWRRAGHHGGRQDPAALRDRLEVGRLEYPLAPRAAAERLYHAPSVLPVPLFCHTEVSFCIAGEGVGGFWRHISPRSTSFSTRWPCGKLDGCRLFPIILFGREYWEPVIDFQFLADQGVYADTDLDLLDFAETAAEAWAIIQRGPKGQGSGIRG